MVVRSDVKLISSRVRECTPRKNPHATFPRYRRAVYNRYIGIGFAIENVDRLPVTNVHTKILKCYRDFGRLVFR